MPRQRKRKSVRRAVSVSGEAICKAPGCGRPAYARGCCQTHHRQLLTWGKLKPIRRYRERTPGTVKFGGLRLSPTCAELVAREAEEKGLSLSAAIAAILEAWHAGKR